MKTIAALAASLLVFGASASAEERGAELFAFCSQCHGADGGGNELYLAPAIAGLPEWYVSGQLQKFRTGMRGTHYDDIGGMRMRPMSMWLRKDEDVAAVAAHVAELPATNPAPTLQGGNAAAGKAIYAPCTACHAADASGNEQLQGPPLRGASDWYLLKSLSKFKAGVRGSNPADQYGIMMSAMAANLADVQAMKDVIAYIATFSE
ncbi:MAG: c-type cytochrome [Myxococcota bacterium]